MAGPTGIQELRREINDGWQIRHKPEHLLRDDSQPE